MPPVSLKVHVLVEAKSERVAQNALARALSGAAFFDALHEEGAEYVSHSGVEVDASR